MKADDLMAGDRVLLFGDKPVKVDCIGNVEVYLSDENGIDWRVTYEHIKPIPLTPEILEKNGFEKQGFDGWDYTFGTEADNGHVLWRTDYGIPHLMIESYSSKYGDFRSFGIQYVHELQHALRLCGINLEIKL